MSKYLQWAPPSQIYCNCHRFKVHTKGCLENFPNPGWLKTASLQTIPIRPSPSFRPWIWRFSKSLHGAQPTNPLVLIVFCWWKFGRFSLQSWPRLFCWGFFFNWSMYVRNCGKKSRKISTYFLFGISKIGLDSWHWKISPNWDWLD